MHRVHDYHKLDISYFYWNGRVRGCVRGRVRGIREHGGLSFEQDRSFVSFSYGFLVP